MSPPAEDQATTLAVVVARLDDVREDIRELRTEVTTSVADKVSRGEWNEHKQLVESRHAGLGREIAQLRTELASRRMPWPAVGALVVAIVSLAWAVFGGA